MGADQTLAACRDRSAWKASGFAWKQSPQSAGGQSDRARAVSAGFLVHATQANKPVTTNTNCEVDMGEAYPHEEAHRKTDGHCANGPSLACGSGDDPP
jgi:hypothetical protein